MLFEFSLLFLRIALLVGAFTLEGQGVEGILWFFFMEDVVLPVFPVGETLHVVARPDDRLLLVVVLLEFLKLGLDFMTLVGRLVLGVLVHGVGVDDFSFLLEVECLCSVVHAIRLLSAELEIFLVATEESLGVWVPHEFIGAPSLSLRLVTNSLKNIVGLDHSVEVAL